MARSDEPDAPVRRTTRPALDVLQRNQQRLLFDGNPDRTPPLRAWIDGVDSRRELVDWWQAAATRTFGHIADEFESRQLLADQTLLEATLDDGDGARSFRRRVCQHILTPACQRAYEHLRDRAEELTSGGLIDEPVSRDRPAPEVDVDVQHVAMRPAFSRLDAEQATLLDELWGGFDDRDELVRWCHSLTPATRGHHPDDLAGRLLADPTSVDYLLGDTRAAATYREKFATVVLLPAFADAARSLQGGAQTATDTTTSEFKNA